ncbi:hypothetical protein GGX14DRAFT_393682 [Mycena pura]|uniref:Uncharacterized protein n=1 Tax=Mycena pura TaxID=153505 RepID=A0AAD6VG20_9AGAR|nr:hypothetical protein GGX14DRAFT_393682 [Mycena pura]
MHVAQISRYYAGMDDLSAFTCMATYGSIACSLVTDAFMWSESERAELSSALADANNERWNTVGKGGKIERTGGMASGRRSGNGNDEGGDGGRRGGRKGGRGGGRGGRGRGDQDISPEERPEGKRFKEATHFILQVPAFTTPPKGDSFCVPTIEDMISRYFANLTIPGGLLRYDPDEDDEGMGDKTQRTLIHGTRNSDLPKFMINGICPLGGPNTLYQGPAFYTTTHAEYPVALLIFNISPPVIHGNRRIDNHPMFSCLWFQTHSKEDNDLLIKPNREGTTVNIPQFPYLPAGTQPTQVAAGTEAGWLYLSSCVDARLRQHNLKLDLLSMGMIGKQQLCISLVEKHFVPPAVELEPSVEPVEPVSAAELLPEPSPYPPELTTALSSSQIVPSVTDVSAESVETIRPYDAAPEATFPVASDTGIFLLPAASDAQRPKKEDVGSDWSEDDA